MGSMDSTIESSDWSASVWRVINILSSDEELSSSSAPLPVEVVTSCQDDNIKFSLDKIWNKIRLLS